MVLLCTIASSTKDKGQDVGNQLAQLRDFAGRQGWQVTQEYVDEVSGSTADRARFQQMFRDASQARFDILLFWSLDRYHARAFSRLCSISTG